MKQEENCRSVLSLVFNLMSVRQFRATSGIRMRRLKTRHSYHDAEVRAVEFGANDSIVFEVELCGCSGSSGTIVHLSFHGVRNVTAVHSFIQTLLERAKGRARIAEIIGIARDARHFLLDLDQGLLCINAKSFTET
jgi:hypothetical protein